MRRLARWVGLLCLLAVCAVFGYGYSGWRDARADAEALKSQADQLIAEGRGGVALGLDRRAELLAVEDPAFEVHAGFDLTTPGAGTTTITQSLAKREGFADFTPGLQKIRQTGYAIGLESKLSKPEIMALFLESVPMGRGPEGQDAEWISGLFAASEAHFGASPDRISDEAFRRLVAVMIAPGQLELAQPNLELAQREARIAALLAGRCAPIDNADVWLEGCADG